MNFFQHSRTPAPRRLPRHLAVIMDGNGRWAESRALPRSEGHRIGAEKLRFLCRLCGDAGIRHLSAYAFSTENWRRPQEEVRGLMALVKFFASRYANELAREGVRVRFAGRREQLSPEVLAVMDKLSEHCSRGDKLDLVICLDYGGRDEIVRAFRRYIEKNGALKADFSEDDLRACLDLPDLPDPDLIFRPGGEQRLSNFWLWQSAYAEFYFSETLWPDFSENEFESLLRSYAGRQRRFGNCRADGLESRAESSGGDMGEWEGRA